LLNADTENLRSWNRFHNFHIVYSIRLNNITFCLKSRS
jgi:hypothetical protein